LIYHDSRSDRYRSPGGAVLCGTEVKLRLFTDPDTVSAEVHLTFRDEPLTLLMARREAEDGSLWEAVWKTPEVPGLALYDFVVRTEEKMVLCGAPCDGLGGEGEVCEVNPPQWQITVHLPQRMPDWLKKGICYQIFPDRFYAGDGPRVEHAHPGSLLHTSWDDTPFYIRDENMRVARWDFFGGNLKGIEEKLPYLETLGVTVVYLNPIFLSASNHRYDTADYRKVDPLLGSELDLRSLVCAAKKRGIHILLDGVFSHTGSDSVYFNKEGRYPTLGAYQSKESPYYEWYRFQDYPDRYECWWGVDTMPNVWELTPSYLEYQVTAPDSTVRHWMRCGIAGWRLDVADELPDAFLRELRRVVLEENPEAVLLGEVWEDASHKVSYGARREYLLGQELDSVTDYPFREGVLDFLLGHIDARTLSRRLESLRENYPRDIFYALMNMTGTHDTIRLTTLLGGAPDTTGWTETQREAYRLSKAARELAEKRLRLFTLMQYTHPGMPTLYYGDEIGMEGLADPFNRGPFPWGKEGSGQTQWLIQLARLRKDHEALRNGDWHTLEAGSVYAACREGPGERFYTLINPAECAETVTLPASVSMEEVFTGTRYEPYEGEIHIEVAALTGILLREVQGFLQ